VDNLPPGLGNHRRHVIPSHLILRALCRQANDHPDAIRGQLLVYAAAYMPDSPTFSLQNTCTLLAAVARHIHSNPRNLWPGWGPENSVIGFVGHDLEVLLRGIDRSVQLREAPVTIINRVLNDLLALMPGMYADVRRQTLTTIRAMVLGAIAAEPPSRALPIMRSLLQDIRDSLDFDTSQLGSWKTQNEQAIALYWRFARFAKSSDGSFWDIVHCFMMLDTPLITMATLVQLPSGASSGSSSSASPRGKRRKHF
jgi:hypothetical protein